MKFSMNVKEFKALTEKALTVAPKKSSVPALECIKISVSGGIVTTYGSDLERFVSADSYDGFGDMEDGSVLIDQVDLKMLYKMKGDITLSENPDSKKISVKNGKKVLNIPKQDLESFPEFPVEPFGDLIIKENEFLESLVNLASCIALTENNKMMSVFNLNWAKHTVETLDGHRIGLKHMQTMSDGTSTTYGILGDSIGFFKKALDKLSVNDVLFGESDKYINVHGNDFTYIQRKVDGSFFKTDQIINSVYCQHHCVADSNAFLETCKYSVSIADKSNRQPQVLQFGTDTLKTYYHSGRYESFDSIELKESNTDDFMIAVNPQFIVDALSVNTDDYVQIDINSVKTPMKLSFGTYEFVILPVNVKGGLECYTKKFEEMEAV